MLKGHCFCRAVRYEANGTPWSETNCHCSICRGVSGSPYVTWFTVPSAAFQFVSGNPRTFKSSDHGTRTFCANCGTPLTFQSDNYPDEIDISTCSLENPERVPPKDHIWADSKLSWVALSDDLPVYLQERPE